jgi:hypothetical protein
MVMSATLHTLKFKEYLTVDEPPPHFSKFLIARTLWRFSMHKNPNWITCDSYRPYGPSCRGTWRHPPLSHREEEIEDGCHKIKIEVDPLLAPDPESDTIGPLACILLFHPNRKKVYSILHLHHVP